MYKALKWADLFNPHAARLSCLALAKQLYRVQLLFIFGEELYFGDP